ncbi:hypothetical protein [Microbacterium sp. NPDC057944]|uniref:DUF7674 family protein n=1 Tax=Microbacterium sp. NPDC057944 TaxID=3346286 RepID=UPI0036DF78DE
MNVAGATMKSDTQRAIMQLIDLVPQLNPILRESEIDNDEILPHLVLSDVIRWMTNHRADEHEACVTVIRWMEESYAAGSESVQELVVVSGVEMIPDPGFPGSEFRGWLRGPLRAADPWPRDSRG